MIVVVAQIAPRQQLREVIDRLALTCTSLVIAQNAMPHGRQT